MTSILGFADILRSGEVSPATRRTAADYIYHESKRLEALSGNLLALMGLEQQPPQLEAVPLGRVLQSLRRALPQGSPVPTLPRSDTVVLAQPELLCDMLYNLIQNARKATPADGQSGSAAGRNTHPADHPAYRIPAAAFRRRNWPALPSRFIW